MPRGKRDGEVKIFKGTPGSGEYNPRYATEMVKETAP